MSQMQIMQTAARQKRFIFYGKNVSLQLTFGRDPYQNHRLESRTPPEGGDDSLHVGPSSREVRAGVPQTYVEI